MAWPPTNLDTLRSVAAAHQEFVAVRDGKGVSLLTDMRSGNGLFIASPEYLEPLLEDGMIEKVDLTALDSAISGTTSRLTDKGREAIQMLNGHRKVSNYSMPGWLLQELTR